LNYVKEGERKTGETERDIMTERMRKREMMRKQWRK
jgi:hypothetical protein